MAPLLGMAGLAEAAFIEGLCCGGLGVLLTGVLVGLAVYFRSPAACTLAVCLTAGAGVCLVPWNLLLITDTIDPDLVGFIADARILAALWAVVGIAAVGAYIYVLRTTPGPGDPPPPPGPG